MDGLRDRNSRGTTVHCAALIFHDQIALCSGFCACAVREDSRQYLREIQLEYARLLEELVNSGRYDTRDDFTVVLQPHQRDLKPIVDVRSINYPQNFV